MFALPTRHFHSTWNPIHCCFSAEVNLNNFHFIALPCILSCGSSSLDLRLPTDTSLLRVQPRLLWQSLNRAYLTNLDIQFCNGQFYIVWLHFLPSPWEVSSDQLRAAITRLFIIPIEQYWCTRWLVIAQGNTKKISISQCLVLIWYIAAVTGGCRHVLKPQL